MILVLPKSGGSSKILPKDLMEMIREQVELRLPELVVGRNYTLRNICGEDFWENSINRQATIAGQCMSYLVEAKRLPLVQNGKTDGNARRYQLK